MEDSLPESSSGSMNLNEYIEDTSLNMGQSPQLLMHEGDLLFDMDIKEEDLNVDFQMNKQYRVDKTELEARRKEMLKENRLE
jgi:hypothetical protein